MKKFRSLKEEILHLREKSKLKRLSIGDIFKELPEKGRPLVLILLSLPFCQPIQIPGLSIPFGIAIAFIGLRMAFGKKIWLPKTLLKKTIPQKTLDRITHKILSLLKKIKKWIYPRLTWISQSRFIKKGNGLLIFLLGFFLALPLPIPLSNLLAAWSILLLSLGLLEDDGLFILASYFVILLSASILTILPFLLKNS